jgi:hypothetical protein
VTLFKLNKLNNFKLLLILIMKCVKTKNHIPLKAGVFAFLDHPANLTKDISNKGKAVPLQAWSGPEGSRKLRFPDYMITAQDDGKVVSLTHRPTLPKEMLLVLISVRG